MSKSNGTVAPPKPFSFSAGCFAFRSGIGYDVTCCQCCAYIGSMTGDTILRAIMSTRHRGGVLCPDCRKITCDSCGLTFWEDESPHHRLKSYTYLGRLYRVCKTCDL